MTSSHSRRALAAARLATVLLLLALAACSDDPPSKPAGALDAGPRGDGGAHDGGTGAQDAATDGGDAASGAGDAGDLADGGTRDAAVKPPIAKEQVCDPGGICLQILTSDVDELDLLFMVDDSGSMREEQVALRAQFPGMIEMLTKGDRNRDGITDFVPVSSVHLGVVSSDLGLVGIRGIDRCDGLGDDGVMQSVPSPDVSGCATSYPRFLTYTAGVDSPEGTANDLGCIATLGTMGCGFEQQLESALKALWPSDDTRVTFLPDPMGFGANGQGDAVSGGAPGANAGFLRSAPMAGSALGIVVVTDEEDCSSLNTSHFRPSAYLDPSNAIDAQLLMQGLNVRCHFNPQNLYAPERYVNAFKALRPGREDLVLFSAIVGVPPDTVATIPADFATSLLARNLFYEVILDHPDMQPKVDDRSTPAVDDDVMVPSCDTASGRAYPPRRIVQVAQGFGPNGMVQSICQADLAPAITAIIDRIADRLAGECLPTQLALDDDGLAECDVVWALPTPRAGYLDSPVACSQRPYLTPVKNPDARTEDGGALCTVTQLPSHDPDADAGEPDGVGWYYDDFSPTAQAICAGRAPARIAFTEQAAPPPGVRVFLDCK